MKRRVPPCPAWGPVPPGYGRPRRGRGCAVVPPGWPAPELAARNGFVRGFIAAGLVAASGAGRPARRETLRLALQGGTAMAAGVAGANAIDRRDYASALVAVAAGAAGLSVIKHLFQDSPSSTKEVINEQEKA